MFIKFITDYFYYVFIFTILVNFIMGRKKGVSSAKRHAILYLAIAIFLLYIYTMTLAKYNLGDIYLIIFFVIIIPIYIVFKKYLFPFTTIRCEKCNKLLSFNQILYFDSKECESCNTTKIEEEPEKSEKK